jgi:hypothetical protein
MCKKLLFCSTMLHLGKNLYQIIESITGIRIHKYLCSTNKARSDHFGNDIHQVFGFLDGTVHLQNNTDILIVQGLIIKN